MVHVHECAHHKVQNSPLCVSPKSQAQSPERIELLQQFLRGRNDTSELFLPFPFIVYYLFVCLFIF